MVWEHQNVGMEVVVGTGQLPGVADQRLLLIAEDVGPAEFPEVHAEAGQ